LGGGLVGWGGGLGGGLTGVGLGVGLTGVVVSRRVSWMVLAPFSGAVDGTCFRVCASI